jgi:nitrogen-specific signal transduction histidine kinase
MAGVQGQLEQRMLGAAQLLEKAVDEELERLDTLGGDELAAIRKKRVDEMKKMAEQKQLWLNAVE